MEIALRLRPRDGAFRAVSLRVQRLPSSGEIHAEITERPAAASAPTAELERDAQLLRAVLDSLPIMVSHVDPQGTYWYHEGKGLEAAGMKPAALVGQNAFEVFSGHPGLLALRQATTGEHTHAYEELFGLPLEFWNIPVCSDRGEVLSVITIALDLSEGKRIETELREKIGMIERQQQVIQEMATPIIEVWDKVLTLPMLGVIDTVRAADVMENLLTQVSRKGARFAILDLTGVEAVDTGTASHLLKLVQALRLLGAEGIITGIQPSVAQTMVALGVNMESVVTLANLRDGLRLCMRRLREEKAGASVKGSAEPTAGAAIVVDKAG